MHYLLTILFILVDNNLPRAYPKEELIHEEMRTMSLYSLKMRASKETAHGSEHISGAEKILHEPELGANMEALLERALHHAKGRADFINLKIEAVQPKSLPTSTPCLYPALRPRRLRKDRLQSCVFWKRWAYTMDRPS